jgi:diguanylate cyclase
MIDYLNVFTNTCIVVTLSYIALKIRNQVEAAFESVTVPVLTGLACLILMLQPPIEHTMILDLRFAPIIMAGLRYGLPISLLSTILPILYSMFSGEANAFFNITQGLLLPALVSSLFHKKEYGNGYTMIRLWDGVLICCILFVIRTGFGFFRTDTDFLHGVLMNGGMLLFSCGVIVVLIAMLNDENKNWVIQRRLELQANQDSLTLLPNLRSFMNIAKNMLRRQRISIFMIDIDNFKNYNDRFGHLQGDQLLKETGNLLRGAIGEQDYIARYGGEEFIVMCQEKDPDKLARNAQRLCDTVSHNTFKSPGDPGNNHITVSVGIAIASRPGEDLRKLIAAADEALYVSKNTGKNKFSLHSGFGNLEAQ